MFRSRILFLLLSFATVCLFPSCAEKKEYCVTLETYGENGNGNLKQDIEVLKTRLGKICGSCSVTESADLKNIKVCSSDSEKDLISEFLMTPGKVEFLETFENHELFPNFFSIDSFLTTTDFVEAATAQLKKNNVNDSVAKEHPLFALLTIPYIQTEYGETQLRKGPAVGWCTVNDTSLVMQMLSSDVAKERLPKNITLLWSAKPFNKEFNTFELIAVSTAGGDIPSGRNIKKARASKGDYNDSWVILTEFDEHGTSVWRNMTANNIGRSIAICIDNRVFSYPTVMGEIPKGASVISGNLTRKEADMISAIVSSGELISHYKIKN